MDAIAKHNASFYSNSLAQRGSEPGTPRIRLLTILPGRFDDPIEAKLHVCELGSESYCALSYVWGTAENFKTITVDGRAGFQVTYNAFCAMRRMRHVSETVTRWIDAVCIKQADVEERSAQVAMMGSVFSQAAKVIAWLGRCTGQDLEGTEPERCIQVADDGGDMHWALPTLDDCHSDSVLADPRTREPQAWWSRGWTFQEAVLAKELELLIGPHHIQLDYDTSFRSFFGGPLGLMHALFNIKMFKERGLKSGLYELLQLTTSRYTSDPRDKVYSLRALCDPSSAARSLPVGYSKTLSEVAYDAVASMIQDGHDLRQLHEAFSLGGEPMSCSWLPDIFNPFWFHILTRFAIDTGSRGLWDPPELSNFIDSQTHISDGGVLETEGVALDTVLYIAESPLDWLQSAAPASEAARLVELNVRLNQMTAACAKMRGHGSAMEWQLFTGHYRDQKAWYDFRRMFSEPSVGFGFFITEGGLVVIAGCSIQEGDRIALLPALYQPVALRRVDSAAASDRSYRAIGNVMLPLIHLDHVSLDELHEMGHIQVEKFRIV